MRDKTLAELIEWHERQARQLDKMASGRAGNAANARCESRQRVEHVASVQAAQASHWHRQTAAYLRKITTDLESALAASIAQVSGGKR